MESFALSNGTFIRLSEGKALANTIVNVKLEPGVHWFCQESVDMKGEVTVHNRLTSSAYDMLASICGISTVLAEHTIGDDGVKRANPFIVQKNGVIESVLVRVYAIGRGPAGNMRVVDMTLLHAPYALFAGEVYEKWLNVQMSGGTMKPNQQPWGKVVNNSAYAAEGTIRFPIGGAPDISLQVDAGNVAVLLLLRKHKDDCQYAERTAVSMATRAAIGKLLGVRYAKADGSVDLPVWVSKDLNSKDVISIIESGVIDGEVVEVVSESSESSEVDKQSVDDVAPPVVEAKPKLDSEQLSAEIRAALKQYKTPSKNPVVLAALNSVRYKTMNELSTNGSDAEKQRFLNILLAEKE